MSLKDIQKAARSGDAKAQYELALRYYHGRGGARTNKKLALAWFTRGAEQKHGRAMFRLGRMYHEMKSSDANLKSALKWLTVAAAESVLDAIIYLGHFHVQAGEQIPESRMHAYMWYKVAALTGDPGGREMCQDMLAQLSSEELKAAVIKSEAFVRSFNDIRNHPPTMLA